MAAIPINSNPQTIVLPDGNDNTLEISPDHPLFGGARTICFVKISDAVGNVQVSSFGPVTADSPPYITDDELPPISASPAYPVHVKGATNDEIIVSFVNG